MFISLQELELHKIEFDQVFQPGAIELGAGVRQRAELHTGGRAELLKEHHGKKRVIEDIRVVGELSTSLEVPCARCLDPVVRDIERQFDLLYRPQGTDAGHEELSVPQAEAEIGYYTGDGLQLEDVVREQLLLSVPLKALCRDDCKGLCPHCGKNRNLEACDCRPASGDPRWAALEVIRKKLE